MKDEGLLAPEAVVLLRGRGCCGGVVGFGLGQAEVVAAAALPARSALRPDTPPDSAGEEEEDLGRRRQVRTAADMVMRMYRKGSRGFGRGISEM